MAMKLRNISESLVHFLALFHLVSSKAQWYMANDGHDYLIEDEVKYNWLEANDECARQGLQLAVFPSQAKINHLDALLRSIFAKTPDLFLGMHDEFNKKKDKTRPFYEVSSGEKIVYTNWQQGQPDNMHTEEHCVHIHNVTDFKWNDVRCEYKYGFICEEHHLTAKYRLHMDAQRLEVNNKNTKLSSKFANVQADIKSINEKTQRNSDSIMQNLKDSTDEIIANVKQSIKDIIMKKPYMEAVIADFNDSIAEVVLENEKEFDKLSDEARQMLEDVQLSAESSTSEVTLKFSEELTTNLDEINELLVY